MRILVVNDDGIESLGVWALAGALRDAGLGEVLLVAPEVEQSGTSMALPYQRELTLRAAAPPVPAYEGIAAYAFNGTPVGCVLAGMLAGLGPRPDVVVSGINRGLNSGTNVLLSGTVGAAMLGAMWGLPALAVSQMFVGDAPMPWGTAAWAAVRTFPLLEGLRGRGPVVLNVNVPHIHELDEVRGFRQTRLSSFFYGDVVDAALEEAADGEGRRRLTMRFNRERLPQFADDTDDGAVRAGYVSLTPLSPTGAAALDLAPALAAL
ncbi:MAG TPA: 5'/3'-nucleotidase SurE [Chloroflexaceae bacterium]|nr:5'/3'-nucleotidase SurE [Chloroflexaceae bacterium]